MTRHSTSFKHSVVSCYLNGDLSFRDVGSRFGIDHGTVRKWVSVHAEHGLAGLTKKFSRYDAAFKLSVLQRMWNDSLSFRQTAALFNIRNASSVSEWQRCYERGGIDALAARRKGKRRSMPEPPLIPAKTDVPHDNESKSREELLAELSELRMESACLKKLEALTQARQLPTGRKSSRR
ncbi:helix-turn-helix domain-containing protein [Stappia sp. ES.058]|uniref:helix-turn-helix domain-containing protein n=1 Tax=Stappia sp. ES.058 TaxID=1881061 RepID=UPI00087A577C|nr:helix-turn-helix domain-containing protein [Stappia sp. ES.058]SDU34490.1 transposase [Stappia sp. ES.058]